MFVLIGGFAILLWLLDRIAPVIVWDGRFSVTVNIQASGDKTVESISYASYFKREIADWVADHAFDQASAEFTKAEFIGSHITADIPCSGKESLFGREFDYVELSCLVLRIDFTDGSRTTKTVEVPTGRGPRSLKVVIDE